MIQQNSDDVERPEGAQKNRSSEEQPDGESPVRGVVRLQKTIHFDESVATHFDESVINSHFYEGFNYSLLSEDRPRGKIALGVTSPNPGDGKTTVAANLAVSLAHSTEREVVLVDMNVRRPRIHSLFSISKKPGLMESLNGMGIHVSATKIRNLAVLSLGDTEANALQRIRLSATEPQKRAQTPASTVRLEDISEFRNVLYSLEERFDLIIVDLPSLAESAIPTLFVKQLDGIVVVVNAGRTKQANLDKLIKQLDPNKVVGFVFNRSKPDQVV